MLLILFFSSRNFSPGYIYRGCLICSKEHFRKPVEYKYLIFHEKEYIWEYLHHTSPSTAYTNRLLVISKVILDVLETGKLHLLLILIRNQI